MILLLGVSVCKGPLIRVTFTARVVPDQGASCSLTRLLKMPGVSGSRTSAKIFTRAQSFQQ